MDKIKYLYIEDDENSINYKEKLEYNNSISIEFVIIQENHNVLNIIKNKINSIDGILIDFRLDEKTGYYFKASAIAQEFREKVVDNEDGFIDKPIVLISTDEKIKKIYEKETTSHDLFDTYIKKEDLDKTTYQNNKIIELISLAKGYKQIRNIKNIFLKKLPKNEILDEIILELLQINKDQNYIDTNIFGRLLNNPDSLEHEYANFLIKELLNHPGYLINEYIFAARLGISLKKLNEEQKKEWEKIKEHFKEAKYNGVFSDGWQRWWMSKINEIFEELSDGTYLVELDAEQRVQILKERLSLINIEPAQPIEGNNSTEYWTVCKALKEPLDTIEGFKSATEEGLFSWQEYEYYSLHGLINYVIKKIDDYKKVLHPDEWERFFELVKESQG